MQHRGLGRILDDQTHRNAEHSVPRVVVHARVGVDRPCGGTERRKSSRRGRGSVGPCLRDSSCLDWEGSMFTAPLPEAPKSDDDINEPVPLRPVEEVLRIETHHRLPIRSVTIIAAARLVVLMSGLFMALVPMSAQSMESLQEKPTMIKQTIVVAHVRIESAKSFADVRAALERSVPHLDPGLVKALDDGDVERADLEKKEGPELSIFQVRDHGTLLKIAGKARNALQYDIGNPVTASLMVRHQLSAALYAPIRVVLYENDAGHGVFEYDQPSTTFGQFGDERVTAVARGLDAALARALSGAAE